MSGVSHSSDQPAPAMVPSRTAHADLWHRYQASGPGDPSEEELLKKNLHLVKGVVGRLALALPSHVDNHDLYSTGMVGLLNAIRQYKTEIGTAFEPYARLRIRGAIIDELRRLDWVPRTVHAKARKVQAAMEQVEQAKGALPTDEEVAAALKMSLRDYRLLLDEIRPVTFICLDAAFSPNGDDDSNEHELIPAAADFDASEKTSRAELAGLIAERIKELPDINRKVIALYYFEGLRLREIAEVFGLSESRICQIHTQSILAIRLQIEQFEASAKRMATI